MAFTTCVERCEQVREANMCWPYLRGVSLQWLSITITFTTRLVGLGFISGLPVRPPLNVDK